MDRRIWNLCCIHIIPKYIHTLLWIQSKTHTDITEHALINNVKWKQTIELFVYEGPHML